MSAATSPGTGLAYGLQRVCAAWGFARSSFYAMKSRQQATAERPPAKRRGPKPSISDEALLVAIEADLEASPWEGEGHRKVWARLRVCRGIRVSRKRVLRVMRENNLLSPHRCRRRGGNPHVGEIITHAPNLMWGTDGVRVFTVDDGWGWVFTAIEHWNAECVGWHVCKRGDRFAALQPISMGLARLYASTSSARATAKAAAPGSRDGAGAGPFWAFDAGTVRTRNAIAASVRQLSLKIIEKPWRVFRMRKKRGWHSRATLFVDTRPSKVRFSMSGTCPKRPLVVPLRSERARYGPMGRLGVKLAGN